MTRTAAGWYICPCLHLDVAAVLLGQILILLTLTACTHALPIPT